MTQNLQEDFLGIPPNKEEKKTITNENLAKIYGNLTEEPSSANTDQFQFEQSSNDIIKVKVGDKTYSLVSDRYVTKVDEHLKTLYARLIRLEKENTDNFRTISAMKSIIRQNDSEINQLKSKLSGGRGKYAATTEI